VFAPNSDVTASLTRVIITQSLEKWIGNLIEVIDVTTLANEEKLEIKIIYLIKARQERRYLNVELTL
jgi:predicted transposase YdaD